MRLLLAWMLVGPTSCFLPMPSISPPIHLSSRISSRKCAKEERVPESLQEGDQFLQEDRMYNEKTATTLSRWNRTLDGRIIQKSSGEISSASTLSNLVILGLGTYAVSMGTGELLIQFEWFQAWRYIWPLSLGGLYVFEALNNKSQFLPFSTNRNTRVIGAILGVGLIVGGAYDAFMPVWSTGPNVVTSAGLNQDSATALMVLSIYSIFKDATYNKVEVVDSSTRLLLQMLLLGQLFKLGEGTIDELIGILLKHI